RGHGCARECMPRMAELAHHIGDDILPELRAPAARGKMLLHEKGEAPSARCTWGALRMIRAMRSVRGGSARGVEGCWNLHRCALPHIRLAGELFSNGKGRAGLNRMAGARGLSPTQHRSA